MNIIIIGGGLSGLVNSILLQKAGFSVILFEEKKYPFHRVCGEYISNEVIPFLKREDLFPAVLQPSNISRFQLTSPSGSSLNMPLDLGGFGVSRYNYDLWLSEKARDIGVNIIHERVTSCEFGREEFTVISSSSTTYQSKLVIGSFGKRSWLDKKLDREFMRRRSPYVGVKYHIKTNEVASDLIALHNFHNGYCGVSKIENETFNLCYLTHRDNLKNSNIPEMEEKVLKKNPQLRRIFNNSEFLFEKPEVINEISFEKKGPVFNHILMAGDSAGMITPLCGNGMAIAIHSSKILSNLIITYYTSENFDREKLETEYSKIWNSQFTKRLWAGRKIQSLFGSVRMSEIAVSLGKKFSPFSKYLMSKTHGTPFS